MNNKTKWSKLLADNEDAIIEALEKAYSDACGSKSHSGFGYYVIIDEDGEIRISTLSQNSTPGDVWKGTAMSVGGMEWFSPFEWESESEIIENSLSPEEAKEFTSYCGTEDIDSPNLRDLDSWNSDVALRVQNDYIEEYAALNARDWAESRFTQTMMDIKSQEDQKMAESYDEEYLGKF